MDRSLIRTPKGWMNFDFFAIVISIILLTLLIFFWLTGTQRGSCCKNEVPSTAPIISKEVFIQPEPAVILEPSPYSIELSHTANYAKLIGLVANTTTRTRLINQVKKSFDYSRLEESLLVGDNVISLVNTGKDEANEPFFYLFDNISNMAINLKDGKLGIDPKNIRLSGMAINKLTADSIVQRLKEMDLGGRKLSSNIGITLPLKPVVKKPYYFKETDLDGNNPSSNILALKSEIKKVDCIAVLRASQVEFAIGSATLTKAGKESLNVAHECLSSGQYSMIGHTDNTGSEGLNQKLSLARAESAMAYVISLGVEKSRLFAEGKGASEPFTANNTDEGRSQNRRIEFQLR